MFNFPQQNLCTISIKIHISGKNYMCILHSIRLIQIRKQHKKHHKQTFRPNIHKIVNLIKKKTLEFSIQKAYENNIKCQIRNETK